RRFAAAISQAPGLCGMPDSGHCSSAATRASWARSSATATSRTMRVSPAISRADSIRQTASIARLVADAVMFPPTASRPPARALPDPVSGDDLLGLGERTVDHGPRAAVEADLGALGGRVQALAGQHHARLDELFVVFRHRPQELRAGHLARLGLGAAGD